MQKNAKKLTQKAKNCWQTHQKCPKMPKPNARNCQKCQKTLKDAQKHQNCQITKNAIQCQNHPKLKTKGKK